MLTRKAQKCWREHISRPESKGFSLKKTKTRKSMNCSAPSTFLTDKVTWPFNDDQWRICPRTANYRAHMFRFDKSFWKSKTFYISSSPEVKKNLLIHLPVKIMVNKRDVLYHQPYQPPKLNATQTYHGHIKPSLVISSADQLIQQIIGVTTV